MATGYTFDTSYLLDIITERANMYELTKQLGISKNRITRIISGDAELNYSEMLAFAQGLHLTSKEFERCFFMPASSENLNQYNDAISGGKNAAL